MREIDLIVIHCSATKESQRVTTEDIRLWHMRDRNFSDIGYHYVIEMDGDIKKGRPVSRQGAHARGYNQKSIGICYIGGLDSRMNPTNTMTREQELSLTKILRDMILRYPKAKVVGHNELSSKDCPSFNVQEWLKENGFPYNEQV